MTRPPARASSLSLCILLQDDAYLRHPWRPRTHRRVSKPRYALEAKSLALPEFMSTLLLLLRSASSLPGVMDVSGRSEPMSLVSLVHAHAATAVAAASSRPELWTRGQL
ncbi:hypothetical protein PR003_g12836 [Phytophthora rubi]|uniref:Uncharacterized protein n=1 Tax=Phytophthora rubi TaxID=129364 RepID=A0A6A4F3U7_9STRA|nr:hypothetical protein PR002_g17312 [Phytophthora rubi]KAE9335798.1 hypothetical protein PR003_g12836 [Phytophthora rubi]